MITATKSMEEVYQERLTRYVTAMRMGKPDRVPIRPFAAEFAARYAGYNNQQVTHDYDLAFDAVLKMCADFDWDAAVPNMVWVWTGLTDAMDLKYYGVPGIHIEPDVGFQYREPPETEAFMRADEYDEFIENPTRYAYEVWLPRVSNAVPARGEPASYRSSMSLVKGALGMNRYFNAFGGQIARMREETGTLSAISGMLKAPMDVLADKFRGYIGMIMDLQTMPEKVLAACEAMQPHLQQIALSGLDPTGQLPIPIWMHRGCVPFISYDHFDKIYWKTLKPMVEEIWSRGNQTLFYAEGRWDGHLERFAELPPGAIIYHIDQSDPKRVKEVLGGRFAISGGIPNFMLTLGTPEDVKAKCKEMIDLFGENGGYIMDASAIIQNDATVETMRAMTDFTREYGVYGPPSQAGILTAPNVPAPGEGKANPLNLVPKPNRGLPFEERLKELPPLQGDPDIVKRIHDRFEDDAHWYIWNVVLSF